MYKKNTTSAYFAKCQITQHCNARIYALMMHRSYRMFCFVGDDGDGDNGDLDDDNAGKFHRQSCSTWLEREEDLEAGCRSHLAHKRTWVATNFLMINEKYL